ncbi:MAG: DUF2891 domain-containing protein [Microbacteriaceae bacterium]|nr:DUF2891 domain-containing protein [Microbacteriaceae bacterium]MCL2795676.1 DUF2891 domain-containing protein [Microbacteriaceae bacterium]
MSAASALRAAYADRFAAVALANFAQPYPYAAHHTTSGPDDRALPVELHPAFASSYDWHSSVHMHWLATRLLESGVAFSAADALAGALTANLSAANLAVEADYLRAHPLYERPYGWGWALALAASAAESRVPVVATLASGFAPLTAVLFESVLRWVAHTPEPVRHGVHSNSAFALRHALLAARVLGRDDVAAAVADAARRWFGADRGWPFAWERSGHDFLSPGFAEADLMAAVLGADEFAEWADVFFSALGAEAAALRPARVVDEHDGQQVHLFGLGLSTAAAAARVAAVLPGGTEAGSAAGRGLAERLAAAAPLLLPAGLEASVSDEFMSSHWLATFAWDALEALDALG